MSKGLMMIMSRDWSIQGICEVYGWLFLEFVQEGLDDNCGSEDNDSNSDNDNEGSDSNSESEIEYIDSNNYSKNDSGRLIILLISGW